MSQYRVQRVAKVAGEIVAAACLMIAGVAHGDTPLQTTVVAWGESRDGQTNVPADLVGATQLAAGEYHTVALKNDGTVVAWGWDGFGQTSVPTDLTGVTQIAAGYYHTVALKDDGTVVGWGAYDTTDLPPILIGVTQIAAGYQHTVALKNDGTVVAWGWNYYGQTSVPADLIGVTQVAAGSAHTVALKNGGTVVAWGNNQYGQTSVPTNLTGVTQVAAGGAHTVALKNDGTVVAWGFNVAGQTTVPTNLTSVTQVAAGGYHTVALKNDGTVVAWGANWSDQISVPDTLTVVTHVAAGVNHTVVLDLGDCNRDNLRDSDQIAADPSLDRNHNFVIDSCDVDRGLEEDCDDNGVIDSYQQQQTVLFWVESPQVGPIGYTSPRTIELAAPPYTLTYVTMKVTALGDFSSGSEYLKIYLNGRWVGEVFSEPGGWGSQKNDCRSSLQQLIPIPRDFFNEAINAGDTTSAVFEVVPSIAVNANQCPGGSWVKIALQYEAAVTEDCNANGLLDVCEIDLLPEIDGDSNGIIDACQNYTLVFYCPGDLDGSASIDTGDMSLLLISFGAAMPGDPADLDASGQIDTADLSLMLLSFGDC